MLRFIKKAILSLVLVSIVSIYAEVIEKDGYKVITDTLKGSNITIQVPDKLSGNLLLLVHGYRGPENPLSSKFSTDGEFYQKLVKEGWIIGSTSYRRNGVILFDAIEDVEYLKKHIEDKYGKSKNVYLKGGSMGGMIIAMMAEKKDNQYKGAIAIGAALTMQEEEKKYQFTYEPQIPILFLTNQSELKRPQDYISKYKGSEIAPVLWKVNRDGHCNTNGQEELLALDALIKYIDTGKIEKNKEILVELKEKPSTAVFKDDKAFTKVLSISKAHGNMNIDIRKSDLEKLGIKHGEYFQIGHKDKYYDVYWGNTYGDVEYGYWVAFFQANGNFKVARNYKNAVKLMQCKEDDLLYVNKIDKPTKEDHYKESDEVMKFVDLYSKSLTNKDFATALKHIEDAKKLSNSPKWLDIGIGISNLLLGNFETAKEEFDKHDGYRFEDGSMYYDECVLEGLEDLMQFLPENENVKKMYKLYNEEVAK